MPHYSHFFRILVVVLFFCHAVPALSAPRYLMLDNPVRVSFSGFASAMAVAGDVDGDGANDLLIGAYDAQVPYEAPQHPAEHQGQAFVFSGKSGKLLFTLNVPVRMPYAAFGFSVARGKRRQPGWDARPVDRRLWVWGLGRGR